MSKKIAKLLKADMPTITEMLRSRGRGKDSILAHINPREAALLRSHGGSGRINPHTGLPEFDDGFDFDANAYDAGGYSGGETPDFSSVTPSSFSSDATQQNVSSPAAQQQDIYGGVPQPYPTSNAPQQPSLFSSPPQQQAQETGAPYQLPQETTQPATTLPGPGAQTQDKSLLDKVFGKLSSADLTRLGLAGTLGLAGVGQSRRAAQQAQNVENRQQAIAAPYQSTGQQLQRNAMTGQLTPANQQSLQALRAQLAQGASNRGGVGANQIAAQTEAFRQQLLQNQYTLGLHVSQIGDQVALGAIKTGLEADREVSNANMNFYTQLAQIAAGLPLKP